MLRRRRDGWSDWCVAHVLFPVYVILLVCLLANAVGVATTDRKTRRKSLASSLSPAVDDVISDDVDSLPPDFDLTTQRPLSNVTSSSLVVTSSRRHRGGGGDRSSSLSIPDQPTCESSVIRLSRSVTLRTGSARQSVRSSTSSAPGPACRYASCRGTQNSSRCGRTRRRFSTDASTTSSGTAR